MNLKYLNTEKLGKNSMFACEQFFNMGISFLIFILIAKHWGAETIGKYNIGLTLVGMISLVTNFGISTIMSREIAKSRKKTRLYLGSAIGIKFLISFPLLVIFTFLYIYFFINDFSTIKLMFLIIINSTILSAINYIGVALNSLQKNQIFFNIVICYKFFLLITVLILIKTSYGLYEFLIFSIFISAVAFIFSFYKINTIVADFKILFKIKFNKVYILTSLPLVLAAFSEFINLKIDILFLGFMLDEEAVGYYSAAFNIILGSFLLPLALTKVYQPNFIKYFNKDRVRAFVLLNKYIFFYLIYSFLIGLVLFLFADVLIKPLYGIEFNQSIKILKYLSFSLLFLNLNRLFNYTLIALKQDKYFLKICIIGSFLNIVLNYFLILNHNIIGAVYATIITELIITLLGYFKIYSLKNSLLLNGI